MFCTLKILNLKYYQRLHVVPKSKILTYKNTKKTFHSIVFHLFLWHPQRKSQCTHIKHKTFVTTERYEQTSVKIKENTSDIFLLHVLRIPFFTYTVQQIHTDTYCMLTAILSTAYQPFYSVYHLTRTSIISLNFLSSSDQYFDNLYHDQKLKNNIPAKLLAFRLRLPLHKCIYSGVTAK